MEVETALEELLEAVELEVDVLDVVEDELEVEEDELLDVVEDELDVLEVEVVEDEGVNINLSEFRGFFLNRRNEVFLLNRRNIDVEGGTESKPNNPRCGAPSVFNFTKINI